MSLALDNLRIEKLLDIKKMKSNNEIFDEEIFVNLGFYEEYLQETCHKQYIELRALINEDSEYENEYIITVQRIEEKLEEITDYEKKLSYLNLSISLLEEKIDGKGDILNDDDISAICILQKNIEYNSFIE